MILHKFTAFTAFHHKFIYEICGEKTKPFTAYLTYFSDFCGEFLYDHSLLKRWTYVISPHFTATLCARIAVKNDFSPLILHIFPIFCVQIFAAVKIAKKNCEIMNDENDEIAIKNWWNAFFIGFYFSPALFTGARGTKQSDPKYKLLMGNVRSKYWVFRFLNLPIIKRLFYHLQQTHYIDHYNQKLYFSCI